MPLTPTLTLTPTLLLTLTLTLTLVQPLNLIGGPRWILDNSEYGTGLLLTQPLT